MNCFSDLVLSADLVGKYKHVLPIFRIPGTDSFIEDPEFNVMMAINLDEHRDLDRWARRSNLLRNICFGRIFARHRAGRPTGRLFEYVDKNPEQQEHPNVSDEQLRTIVRGGLRDGGGMIEGVDFIFPDQEARVEDEVRDGAEGDREIDGDDYGECEQKVDLTGVGLDGSSDPPVQGRVHPRESGSGDIRMMFDSDSESGDDPDPLSNQQLRFASGPGIEKAEELEECVIVLERFVDRRLDDEKTEKGGDSGGPDMLVVCDEGEAANASTMPDGCPAD